jgi:imidazoleglycerol-phosphate dehydratase
MDTAAEQDGTRPLAYHGQGPARLGQAERKTKETQVEVSINLDGSGKCVTETPVGFLNHMLDQIASHGLFDLKIKATGDTWIDDHHTVEDIALALGTAFSQVGVAWISMFEVPRFPLQRTQLVRSNDILYASTCM